MPNVVLIIFLLDPLFFVVCLKKYPVSLHFKVFKLDKLGDLI